MEKCAYGYTICKWQTCNLRTCSLAHKHYPRYSPFLGEAKLRKECEDYLFSSFNNNKKLLNNYYLTYTTLGKVGIAVKEKSKIFPCVQGTDIEGELLW